MLLKIGELAKRTCLTVRTLHHYDAIGLLRPSARSEAGYRLYNREDIERLYRIQALRRLDLPLAEIASLLEQGGSDLPSVIDQQIAALEQQIANAGLLRDRLVRLKDSIASERQPDTADWLKMLELLTILDKHLTPEEAARWRASLDIERGPTEAAWRSLIADINALRSRAIPASSEEAQACARRWIDLVHPHVVREPQIMSKIDAIYRNNPAFQTLTGIDKEVVEYVSEAAAHLRLRYYAKHLTPKQIDAMRAGFLRHAPEWPAMTRVLRDLMERKVAPDSPELRAACLQWQALFERTFGSDPDVQARVRHARRTDPQLSMGSTWDEDLRRFVEEGLRHAAGER